MPWHICSCVSSSQKTVRQDFFRARSKNPFKNLWHPPEALTLWTPSERKKHAE